MGHDHWDTIFESTEHERLGWYESDTGVTWEMLQPVGPGEGKTAFLAGIGTSSLADEMAEAGWSLLLNDLSPVALGMLAGRLPDEADVRLVVQDIGAPLPASIPTVDLWVDRAALHFLTDDQAIGGYFRNVRNLVKPGGHVLLAEFALDGAQRCAGLPVHRYSWEEMSARLGDDFVRVAERRHVYHNPNGDPRPYVYGLFKRKEG